MNKPILMLTALALTALAVPPGVDSAANYCFYLVGPELPPVPATTPVPGPWPNGYGPGDCGHSFLSTTPACPPPPYVGPWSGQYCGPLVPPGAQVVCTANAGPGVRLVALVAGFDTTLDGNIDSADAYGGTPGLAHDGVPDPVGQFTVWPYPHAGSQGQIAGIPAARLIAYPIVDASTPSGVVNVGCS